MKVGSLFSGVGGFDLALERCGYEIAWQVEKDKFCQRVLRKHWPLVTIESDVRGFKGARHEHIDLLVGGFPCQDISIAGKRRGIEGEQSGLFSEIIRIAKETKPAWGLVENVSGLFSSNGGRDMWSVLTGLRQCWSAVGYCVLNSEYFGVPQRRRRVFFVCGATERSVEKILFESEGGKGYFKTSLETRPRVAACLRSRSHKAGVNPPGRGGEEDTNIVMATLQASGAGTSRPAGMGSEPDFCVVSAITNLASGGADDNDAQAGHLIAHALKGEGFDGSEDGTGRGVPLIPLCEVGCRTGDFRGSGSGIGQEGDPMYTLESSKIHGVGVRRLTPIECERLQGFPDGWTCLCDQEPCKCSDGPRYKALGNAVTIPVIEWIGKRIKRTAQMGLGI